MDGATGRNVTDNGWARLGAGLDLVLSLPAGQLAMWTVISTMD